MTMLFKAASYLKAASLSVALVVLLASPAFGQQSNVNLDYNPQKGTEGLTPFSARVNSPEVHDDRTVTFRIDAPNANSVVLPPRSEEHTSELQSRGQLVCGLLLEKKKQ